MAEFVVGQWVECVSSDGEKLQVGRAYQISDIHAAGYLGLTETGDIWWGHKRFKPFLWQVGKTYKTTLEGVTATITDRGKAWLIGERSDMMRCFETYEGMPHLLPYLANELSEPNVEAVKPQSTSPYDRVIGGVEVDLWTLADIYGITSHRLFSAWKKITMAGRRGPKDKLRDLREARVGLDKEIAKLEAEGGE